jgi:signal-transduction protein with cAMP-binding, CBS, and nucleotidyltransferase domain
MMDRAVREVMHKGVITCRRETPIQDVAKQMTEQDISALVVVESNGALAGIISRTDLVNARLYEQYWKHWRGLTAGHIMTGDVVTIGPNETVAAASKRMMERRIHRIVVVEEIEGVTKPAGVLSITDIVRDMADD